jgi:phosphatidylethanolamine/phosphatidyl-N-methylethanolamine N-methyltransferase
MVDTERVAVGATAETPGSPTWLHFRRFLAHPLTVRAVLPASQAFSRLIASRVRRRESEFVVELGAGTGAVTHALLEAGVPADRLLVIEIDPAMADFLRATLPGVFVIEGDAFEVAEAVPAAVIGKAGAIVCGIPLVTLPFEQQQKLVASIRPLLSPSGRFVVFSYCPFSPLPAKRLGLARTDRRATLRNLIPGFVWTYEFRD